MALRAGLDGSRSIHVLSLDYVLCFSWRRELESADESRRCPWPRVVSLRWDRSQVRKWSDQGRARGEWPEGATVATAVVGPSSTRGLSLFTPPCTSVPWSG